MVDFKFAGCTLDNLLLDGTFSNEPINNDLFLLADSVCTVDSLQVDLWVPIRVEDDHNVSLV